MIRRRLLAWAPVAVIVGYGVLLVAQQAAPQGGTKVREAEPLVVAMCDGKTEVEVDGVKAGTKPDRAQAVGAARQLMAAWRVAHPEARWDEAEAETPAAQALPPAGEKKGDKKQAEVYNRFTPRDEFVWKTELDKFVQEGNRIFHNAEAFGGTVSISCDMCHPNASNTHPETYPKYQVQMQKVALLRDMINWCIQHPTKGKPLADDDPRLRAMEAYIIAQRKGKTIEPGKH